MKKLIILLALTSSVFAKFPHENDAKIGTKAGSLDIKQDLSSKIKKIDQMEYDLTEGKILAAMYNMKIERIEELRQGILELLMRVSTVEKLNMDLEKPINVENIINDLKTLDKVLENADAEEIDFKDLDIISNEIENKTIEFESLISRL